MNSQSIRSTLPDKCYFCGRDDDFFKLLFQELFDNNNKTKKYQSDIDFWEAKKIKPLDLKIYENCFKSFSDTKSSLLKKSMLNLTMDVLNNGVDEYSKEVPETVDVLSFFHNVYLKMNPHDNIKLRDLIEYYNKGQYFDDVNKKNEPIDDRIKMINNELMVDYSDDLVMREMTVNCYNSRRSGYSAESDEVKISICPICYKAFSSMGGDFSRLFRQK